MERCLTCKFFSGKPYLPLCSRVLLVNTQHHILPPPCKFEKGYVYEYCNTVCGKESLCGKDAKLYEPYEHGINLKYTEPIMEFGEYTSKYKEFLASIDKDKQSQYLKNA